jgi:hypothetical protein
MYLSVTPKTVGKVNHQQRYLAYKQTSSEHKQLIPEATEQCNKIIL